MSSVATIAAPRLFARSLALVEAWMSELAPKPTAAAAAATGTAQPAAAQPAAKNAQPAAAAAAAPEAGAAAAPARREKQPKGGAAAAAAAEATSMSRVALLCGVVLEAKPHPDSDKLFVEQIDLGEAQPRTIISGLRDHITEEAFTGRRVVVVANLEPRKMRGIPSEGMVLCASTEGKGEVVLLDVPEGVAPGERITFPGHDGPAEPVLKKKLAKHWEDVAGSLRTDAKGVACFGDLPFVTSKGPVTASIPNGTVS